MVLYIINIEIQNKIPCVYPDYFTLFHVFFKFSLIIEINIILYTSTLQTPWCSAYYVTHTFIQVTSMIGCFILNIKNATIWQQNWRRYSVCWQNYMYIYILLCWLMKKKHLPVLPQHNTRKTAPLWGFGTSGTIVVWRGPSHRTRPPPSSW